VSSRHDWRMLTRALIGRDLPTRGSAIDVCRTHELVMAMLGPDYRRPEDSRELWAEPCPTRLLIQHTGELDTRWLPDWCTHLWSGPVRTDWDAGTPIRWAVIANPTVEVVVSRNPPPPDGWSTWSEWRHATNQRSRIRTKRTPIKDPSTIHAWCEAKLEGVQVTSLRLGRRTTVGGSKRDRRVTLFTAHLTGTGIVGDPDRWSRVLRMGIGDGRAYGCGLVVCEAAT